MLRHRGARGLARSTGGPDVIEVLRLDPRGESVGENAPPR